MMMLSPRTSVWANETASHILESPLGQALKHVQVPEDPRVAVLRRIDPDTGPPLERIGELLLKGGQLAQFRRVRRPGNFQQGIQDKVNLDDGPGNVRMSAFHVAEHQRDPVAVVVCSDRCRCRYSGRQRGCNGCFPTVDSR